MEKVILVLLIFLNNFIYSQEIVQNHFPAKSRTCSCQTGSSSYYETVSYEYDDEDNLTRQIRTLATSDSDTTIIDYFYSKGLISKINTQTFVGAKGYDEVFKSTKIFKYNDNKKLIYSGFEDKKTNNPISEYSYNENGILISKTVSCNSNVTKYNFKYDKSGKLIEEFRNGKLSIRYIYYKTRKLKKKIDYHHFNIFRKIIHPLRSRGLKRRTITNYKYDQSNRLVEIIEGGKTIEQRIYKDNRLKEIWIYDNSCDPCFVPCCGDYICVFRY
jgi:YD repeat-containing protein